VISAEAAVDSVEFSLYLVKNSLIDKADDRFKSIMRWKDVDLFRQPLSFLFPVDAHGRVERLLESQSKIFENIIFPRVPIRVKTGGYVNFDMKLNDLSSGNRRLDFYKPGGADDVPQDPQPPTDMYSFFNFVEELLSSPYGGDMGLTMISVDGLREGSSLSEAEKKSARAEVERELQSKAIGGKVGKLDEASYGLITKGDFDEAAFEREIALVAEKLNIAPEALAARSHNIEIDDTDMPPAKIRQALGHSRGMFLGEIEAEHGFGTLTGVIDGIDHNRRLIENALKKFQYRTSARLVTDNVATISLSQLQQGKINLEGKIRLPDEILVMADHPDLALAHDLAQLKDLINLAAKRPASEQAKPDFYELNRSSLIQSSFAEQLEFILIDKGISPISVGFRVRGMPPVKRGGLYWENLNALAEKGHPIWIDRFGDAVVAPEALGCLRHGYIELPPGLLKTLAKHFDGKDLMQKLITTWRALDVMVISVDLPDYEMKTMAQELGITISVEDAPEMGEMSHI
jgi:EAL domain-containing protein (putative c-di-GMP-specific phosphodiesterase class I)